MTSTGPASSLMSADWLSAMMAMSLGKLSAELLKLGCYRTDIGMITSQRSVSQSANTLHGG